MGVVNTMYIFLFIIFEGMSLYNILNVHLKLQFDQCRDHIYR